MNAASESVGEATAAIELNQQLQPPSRDHARIALTVYRTLVTTQRRSERPRNSPLFVAAAIAANSTKNARIAQRATDGSYGRPERARPKARRSARSEPPECAVARPFGTTPLGSTQDDRGVARTHHHRRPRDLIRRWVRVRVEL